MKNLEIVQMYENLQALREHNIPFPARVSFTITQNIRKILPIVEDYENARKVIAIKYGHKDPNNADVYLIDPDVFDQANKEMTDLNDVEQDIQFLKINLSDIEFLQLSIQDMEALYPMVEE